MMGILASLSEAKGAVLAVTAIGGGAIGLHQMHVPRAEYDEFVASNRVQTILQLAKDSRDEGGPIYLCRALEAEFIALCSEQKNHYFCSGQQGAEARKDILAKAKCK